MEETSGNTASHSAEAPCSTASNVTPMTTAEPIAYAADQQQSQELYAASNTGIVETEVPTNERNISQHELKAMLRQQLEYYFSRENLATDDYLRSQMDGDQYVPIKTIAKFNQIRRLTEDLSLVVEALRESPYVQVDEQGVRVRPSQRSIVLILREIPESTPMKDFEELFSGANCPKFSRCEFAHNDTWYVLFDTDEDAKSAYCYLREEAKTFNGKPIMARIKASITSAPYAHSYKNGVVTPPTTEAYSPQQQQQQQQQQPHLQYTFANVPSDSYNNQQICPPFYPPTMLQAWAPTTPACVDLATVFSMNGLSPQATYRPMTNKSSYQARDRPVKSFNPQQNYVNRNDQNSRFYGRNQSYIPRQQQQQQPQQATFHNLMNANSFEYMSYPSGSRNLHSFGFDNLNFFAPPNFCFRKIQGHSTFTSQVRHNPLVLPRNAVGISAINTQDQSCVSSGGNGGGANAQFSKEHSSMSATGKQGADAQGKESWSANQKQRNKRWSKENGANASRHFPENSAEYFNKSVNGNVVKPDSPKFDLETASFPPLPGCMDTDVLDVDVYESRLSDIVKGTVKPSTRDTKTQTSEEALKDSTALDEAVVQSSSGAFTPPDSLAPDISTMDQVTTDEWGTEPLTGGISNDACLFSNSISSATQTQNEAPVFSLTNSLVTPSTPTNTLSMSNLLISPVPFQSNESANELHLASSANVPNESEKGSGKPPMKGKPPCDVLSKGKNSDLPSPKSKVPDVSSGKSKVEAGNVKDTNGKIPVVTKHRPPLFANNKSPESSFSIKDKTDSITTSSADVAVAAIAPSSSTASAATTTSKSPAAEVFSPKDKVLPGHATIPMKGRSFEISPKARGSESEPTVSLLSVNGHIDSESTVSSEDEKPFRKLTYSEVAMRAKEKVEKLAQELKEKERQEALVRHHRQQEITAQSRQGGTFRDFPRRVSERPGSREWRDRRKPARAVSLPSTGQ